MEFDYEVVRTNRKTFSVGVAANNVIRVRCPRTATAFQVQKFVNDKKAWVEKHFKKNSENLCNNADIMEYEFIFICGKKVPLKLSHKIKVTEDYVLIKRLTDIPGLFKTYFSDEITAKVDRLSNFTGLKPVGVFIKSFRRRWGCCDIKGNIAFDFRLSMIPEHLQDYIIIHELCHLKYFNHSAAFRETVSAFLPNWKILKKELSNYDFLMTLY